MANNNSKPNPITSTSPSASGIKNASAGRIMKTTGGSVPNAKGGLGPSKGLTVTN